MSPASAPSPRLVGGDNQRDSKETLDRGGNTVMTVGSRSLLPRTVCYGLLVLVSFSWFCFTQSARGQSGKTYVGSESCKSCHENEYKNFTAYSKKSQSFGSVLRMKKKLTDAEIRICFGCHTTGYGKPGGFLSEAETPHLKNAGCEVCHGPGSLHVTTRNPKDIQGKLTAKECGGCHDESRVTAFNYRPLVYGGAH